MSTARTIVLTGVSRGLGKALAARFTSDGHSVIGCARSPTAAGYDEVDVSDDAAVAAWAERSIAAHGPPDLLINNAAIINSNAPVWEVPKDEFDAVIDVNIKGVMNVLRYFVPAMIARGSGVIVNLSSGWGRSTSPEVGPYCASKFAIEGLTQALAQELPSGTVAVPLNPGIIDTQMLRSCFGGDAASYPDAEEWAARAAPFLLGLNRRHNGRSLDVPD